MAAVFQGASRRLVMLAGVVLCLLCAVVVIALSAPATAEARPSGWCSSMSTFHNGKPWWDPRKGWWGKGYCRSGSGRIRLVVDCRWSTATRESPWLEAGGLAWLYAGSCAAGVDKVSYQWSPR